jgi:hypothetical protein
MGLLVANTVSSPAERSVTCSKQGAVEPTRITTLSHRLAKRVTNNL